VTPAGAADPSEPAAGPPGPPDATPQPDGKPDAARRPAGKPHPATRSVGTSAPAARTDPVLVRRDRYERLANLGQQIGYLLLGIAIVAFVGGFATGFPSGAVTVTIIGLIGACFVLPPAIIAGYAVKAAEREDREAGRIPGRGGISDPGDTMR
jgi:hypothetical protein